MCMCRDICFFRVWLYVCVEDRLGACQFVRIRETTVSCWDLCWHHHGVKRHNMISLEVYFVPMEIGQF